MPRFNANITMLFTELPMMERFAAARAAGFDAVEFLFPYDYEKAEIVAALRDNGLQLVLHNLPPGDWDKGERGMACHPDRIHEFRDGLLRGIDYASALGCSQVNCLAGKLQPGVSAADAREVLVSNLEFAARQLKGAGIRLLMEPINYYDMPGFFVNRSDQALSIMDEVRSDNLFLQYDIYHAQRMEGELAATIEKNLHRIGHMQLADNPGRHEPGTGEINYAFLFQHLDAIGYTGWIGCEYKPKGTTAEGLGWLKALNSAKETAG